MGKRSPRLQFTKEERAASELKKVIQKADMNSEKTVIRRKLRRKAFPLPSVRITVLQQAKTASDISLRGQRIKNCRNFGQALKPSIRLPPS